MHLVMTDQRLYHDDHLVGEAELARLLGHDAISGDDKIGARYFVPLPILTQFEGLDKVVLGRTPGILGTTQTQWWKDTLKASLAGLEGVGQRGDPEPHVDRPARLGAGGAVQPPVRGQRRCLGRLSGPPRRADGLPEGEQHQERGGDHGRPACLPVRDHPRQSGSGDRHAGGGRLCRGLSISSDSFYQYLKAGAGTTPLAPLVATLSHLRRGHARAQSGLRLRRP
ncbi:hypothetical protein LP419_06825 [Massilia sp. H-1]|nr:hypothetical protein LP419_06825 [Massilia sp. H-1]